ncbi:hypothetical protein K439DRAFT_1611550 [Ramaria rubella]|nr:hypothetical protein K439DRAFT_1611550 [Ramaria rubella]
MFTTLLRIWMLTAVVFNAWAAPTKEQMLQFLEQYNKDWAYPRVIEIAKSINYSALDPNVIGRVDVTNTFVGSELNTEYLFGNFATLGTSNTTQLVGVPLNQTVRNLIIEGNSLSVSIVANFNWTVEVVPLEWNVLFMFNDEGKVIQYEATLVRGSWAFAYIIPKLLPLIAAELGEDPNTDPVVLVTKRAALDICSAHESYCTGSNAQYNSTEECMDFIMHKRPFGEVWQAGQDTGMCRYMHKGMVRYRPQVHCVHIGPSGGDMCNQRDYISEVHSSPFRQPFGNPERVASDSTTLIDQEPPYQ